MLNKDFLIATIIALLIHLILFFLNPSISAVQSGFIKKDNTIEVSLVRYIRPLPQKTIPTEISDKRPKKIPNKIKVRPKPKDVHTLKPIIAKKEVKAQKVIYPQRKEEKIIKESEELNSSETGTRSEGNIWTPKLVIKTAIPKYHENPKPHYPLIARMRGYCGLVILNVEVMANGMVGRIELRKSSGYSILDSSAIKAVKKWRFIPGRKGNTPISMWVEIPIRFELM